MYSAVDISSVCVSRGSESQQLLKDAVNGVLEGNGLSWFKANRLKKLMQDENHRNFVVFRMNLNLDKKLPDDASTIDDVVS